MWSTFVSFGATTGMAGFVVTTFPSWTIPIFSGIRIVSLDDSLFQSTVWEIPSISSSSSCVDRVREEQAVGSATGAEKDQQVGPNANPQPPLGADQISQYQYQPTQIPQSTRILYGMDPNFGIHMRSQGGWPISKTRGMKTLSRSRDMNFYQL